MYNEYMNKNHTKRNLSIAFVAFVAANNLVNWILTDKLYTECARLKITVDDLVDENATLHYHHRMAQLQGYRPQI